MRPVRTREAEALARTKHCETGDRRKADLAFDAATSVIKLANVERRQVQVGQKARTVAACGTRWLRQASARGREHAEHEEEAHSREHAESHQAWTGRG